LRGQKISGYIFVLDKKILSGDDLVLGGIVAHEVVARLNRYILVKQLQQAAASEERVRLARDLHDGLLQSLTGAALQLETAQRLIEKDPQTARQRIQEIQRLLVAEQGDLRSHIRTLRPVVPVPPTEEGFDLAHRLDDLSERLRQQYNHAVDIAIQSVVPPMTNAMEREIYFVVHEALSNGARHAGATALRAELSFAENHVQIRVTDDGHGFPFRGRFDQDSLCEMNFGPLTLRERVTSLGGTLAIDSQESGAQLEIVLPLTEQGG
jgi:signal transduction histidine kinase